MRTFCVSRRSVVVALSLAVGGLGFGGAAEAAQMGDPKELLKADLKINGSFGADIPIRTVTIVIKDAKVDDFDVDAMKKVGDPLPFKGVTKSGNDVIVEWDGGPKNNDPRVTNGDKQKVAVVYKAGPPKAITVSQSYYTSENGTRLPIGTKMAKLPGFMGKGDPLFSFSNAFPSLSGPDGGNDMTLTNISLLANVPEIPIESLNTDGLSGASPYLSSLSMPAGFTSQDYDAGPVDFGNFMYVQGNIIDPDTGLNVGTFVGGYGFPVPEAGWGGSAVGILALTGTRRRR